MFRMSHPGIFAILVGVAIGTAIYYYFNSENHHPQAQYREDPTTNHDYRPNNSNNNIRSPENQTPRRRRRRNSFDKCTICLETLLADVASRKLDGCGHEFHAHCITLWLREKKDCPVCRNPVSY